MGIGQKFFFAERFSIAIGTRFVEKRCGVGQRDDHGSIRAKQAVTLPEHPADVFHSCECMYRYHSVEAVGVKEGQFGEVSVMGFHVNFGCFSATSGAFDIGNVGVDRNNARSLTSERYCAGSGTGTKIEHSHSLNFADQTAIEAVGMIGSKFHVASGPVGSDRSGRGVSGPGRHAGDCS